MPIDNRDAFAKRERALEDEFFHRVDEKLRENIRESMRRDEKRQALSAATGIDDVELLDELLDSGFEATTLLALALAPTIFVAWANGSVTPQERQSVMSAAIHRGCAEHPDAMQLIESWLHDKPPKTLWETWAHYAAAVKENVTESMAQLLSQEILRQSTAVAEASGGVLGIGKTSKQEQSVLDHIKEALS